MPCIRSAVGRTRQPVVTSGKKGLGAGYVHVRCDVGGQVKAPAHRWTSGSYRFAYGFAVPAFGSSVTGAGGLGLAKCMMSGVGKTTPHVKPCLWNSPTS